MNNQHIFNNLNSHVRAMSEPCPRGSHTHTGVKRRKKRIKLIFNRLHGVKRGGKNGVKSLEEKANAENPRWAFYGLFTRFLRTYYASLSLSLSLYLSIYLSIRYTYKKTTERPFLPLFTPVPYVLWGKENNHHLEVAASVEAYAWEAAPPRIYRLSGNDASERPSEKPH